MGINFKLLLLLSLVVCTKQAYRKPLLPYVGRLLSLMQDIMIFFITTESLNYDAYFIAPALMSAEDVGVLGHGFLDFFAKDFKLAVHAKYFHFGETETKGEFAKRFFRYIAHAKNVPSNIRERSARFARHFDMRPVQFPVKGSISPCPLYSFVRAVTFLYQHRDADEIQNNSTDVILKFLLTEFNPEAYDLEDKAMVIDIPTTLLHNLVMGGKPLELTDGTLASQSNKELFERLATDESVPQDVKDAIADFLPHM